MEGERGRENKRRVQEGQGEVWGEKTVIRINCKKKKNYFQLKVKKYVSECVCSKMQSFCYI